MKRTIFETWMILLAAILPVSIGCAAETDAPGGQSAAMTQPATIDGGLGLGQVTDEDNPLEPANFREVYCGDDQCGPDQRCCHATGQCFPADCPDCCDGVRQGYFDDGPAVFDWHRGPTGDPVRDDPEEDWIEHDLEPDQPDPAEL